MEALHKAPEKTSAEPRFFVAGDWGSSRLRLFLCRLQGRGSAKVMEQRVGLGIAKVKDPGATLFEVAGDWLVEHNNLPMILSGMVGANIGWRETPYLQCPVHIPALAQVAKQFMYRGHPITIVQGLACTNPFGQPDLMRGEETQIFGWYQLSKSFQNGSHLLCLPGTHSKWLLVGNSHIENFVTGFTGEMYDLLTMHSLLIGQIEPDSMDQDEFRLGVAAVQSATDVQLLHLLFSVRSRQLGSGKTSHQAASFLSGLLIGSDIKGALGLYGARATEKSVSIIGDGQLTSHYAWALESFGFQAQTFNAEDVCLEAYSVIANALVTTTK